MKKLMNNLMIASMILAGLSLTGCNGNNGFQSIDAALKGTTDDNNGQGGGDNSKNADWNQVDMDGYSQGLDTKGKLVIMIDKPNQSIVLVFPVPSFLFMPFTNKQVPVPDLDGAYFTSYETADGSKQLAVHVPLKHIIRDGQFTDPKRLPNGDALPYVPAGELAGFSVAFPNQPNYQVHLYIGVNVAAAFIELPDFDLGNLGDLGGIVNLNYIAKVKNKDKTKEIGAIGYILPKGNFDGGLYLAAQIPKDMAITIDELIKW
jgi:hypothetical protein